MSEFKANGVQLRKDGDSDPVVDSHPAQEAAKPKSNFGPFIAGVGVTALLATAAFSFMSPAEKSETNVTDTKQITQDIPSVKSEIPTDPKEKLAYAFEVATGKSGAFSEKVGDERYQVSPIRLLELPFGLALLTKREIKDGCHGCPGFIGVYYLENADGKLALKASYPEAATGSDWGNAPDEWEVTSKFTANPAIVTNDGYTGQGVTMSSMQIIELTEKGPIASDIIGVGFDNEGQKEAGEPGHCVIQGNIRNVAKDKSFEVVVSGSMTGVDHYRKIKGKFVAQHNRDWGIPCPTPEYRDPAEDEGSGYVGGVEPSDGY